jgi:riboflavin kinase
MTEKNQKKANEKDWFLIYQLAKIGSFRGITLTTQEIAEDLGSSQQTISRRLNKLRDLELIEIKTRGKKSTLKITQKGKAYLKVIQLDLEDIFDHEKSGIIYYGSVQTGMGEGKYYVKIPNYFHRFSELLGKEPFPGTLNVILEDDYIEEFYLTVSSQKPKIIDSFTNTELNRTFGPVNCYYVEIFHSEREKEKIKCLFLDIRRTSHKKGVVEFVSHFNLREKFHMMDDDKIGIRFVS